MHQVVNALTSHQNERSATQGDDPPHNGNAYTHGYANDYEACTNIDGQIRLHLSINSTAVSYTHLTLPTNREV